MTVSQWLATPTPWIGLLAVFIVLGVTSIQERTDRLRRERDERIEQRRSNQSVSNNEKGTTMDNILPSGLIDKAATPAIAEARAARHKEMPNR